MRQLRTLARRAGVMSQETSSTPGTSRCHLGTGSRSAGNRYGPRSSGTTHLVSPLSLSLGGVLSSQDPPLMPEPSPWEVEPKQEAVGVPATQATRMEELVWGGGDCRERSQTAISSLGPLPLGTGSAGGCWEGPLRQGEAVEGTQALSGEHRGHGGEGGRGPAASAIRIQRSPLPHCGGSQSPPQRKPVFCETYGSLASFKAGRSRTPAAGVTTRETTADVPGTCLRLRPLRSGRGLKISPDRQRTTQRNKEKGKRSQRQSPRKPPAALGAEGRVGGAESPRNGRASRGSHGEKPQTSPHRRPGNRLPCTEH